MKEFDEGFLQRVFQSKEKSEKEILRKYIVIPDFEVGAAEEYLENMALKGYFFYKKTSFCWWFRKGTPQKVHYSIEVFDKASRFDTRAEGETLDYKEYCKKEGWELLYTEGMFQYFLSTKVNPVPIETDPERKLNSLHRGSRYGQLWMRLIMILLALLNILSFSWGRSNNPNYFLEISVQELGTILMWFYLILINLVFLLRYYALYWTNRRRINRGEEIKQRSLSQVKQATRVYIGITLLIFAITFASWSDDPSQMIAIILMTSMILFVSYIAIIIREKNKENRSRKENKKIYVIYMILLPVVLFLITTVFVFQSILIPAIHAESTKTENRINNSSKNKIPYTLEDAGFTPSIIQKIPFTVKRSAKNG